LNDVTVSVIVPVRAPAPYLARCLKALREQSYDSGKVEVLVVDNSPAPGGIEVPEGDNVRLLWEPAGGSYAARNLGIANAVGTVVAFTDADCSPSSSWLGHGVRCLRSGSPQTLVAGGVVSYLEHADRPSPVELHDLLFAFRQETYVREFGFGVTANLFAPRRAFSEVGPFNDRLQSSGDLEWCGRALARGFRIVYEPRAEVWHPVRRNWRELAQKLRRVSEGMVTLEHIVARDRNRAGHWQRSAQVRLVEAWSDLHKISRSEQLSGLQERAAVCFVWAASKAYRAWCRLRARLASAPG
jgi:GT2 family glycosyltransferase